MSRKSPRQVPGPNRRSSICSGTFLVKRRRPAVSGPRTWSCSPLRERRRRQRSLPAPYNSRRRRDCLSTEWRCCSDPRKSIRRSSRTPSTVQGFPAYFENGTKRPDPAGRAFLALLDCAAEELSATRFAEYLSLSQIPKLDALGAPIVAPEAGEEDVLWVPPRHSLAPEPAREPVQLDLVRRAASESRGARERARPLGDTPRALALGEASRGRRGHRRARSLGETALGSRPRARRAPSRDGRPGRRRSREAAARAKRSRFT